MSRRQFPESAKGGHVTKDKKKKNGKKSDDKKRKKDKQAAAGPSVTEKLDALTRNPVVAEVVSTALVAMASALKDSKKARQLATEAGDEISKLAKEGAERGNALWDMALQIGRRSLEALGEETPKRSKSKPQARKTPAKPQPKPKSGR
jgi:hypothetical protein